MAHVGSEAQGADEQDDRYDAVTARIEIASDPNGRALELPVLSGAVSDPGEQRGNAQRACAAAAQEQVPSNRVAEHRPSPQSVLVVCRLYHLHEWKGRQDPLFHCLYYL